MRRKIWIIYFCTVILILTLTVPVRAYEESDHRQFFSEVLFGESAASQKDNETVKAINLAVSLAVDQHGKSGQNTLDKLKNTYGISGLPKTIKKFKVGHGSNHRNYTHKGWNYDYEKNDGKDEAHWNDIRKKIILKTVNQEFDFGVWSGKPFMGYDEQCESFAALTYYVHIIADHISNKTYHSNYEEIPLIKGNGEFGIIEDLEKYCAILFEDQASEKKSTYTSFMSDLKEIKSSIKEVYYSPSDLDDPENYETYHQLASDLMDCLKDYIPLLLQKEEFFKKVFYK